MQDRSISFFYMILLGMVSAGIFYLLREHWGHLFGLLPYLLFLACPLMHFFMHGKHGHRHDHRDASPVVKPKENMT
jgi:hypothetical protein